MNEERSELVQSNQSYITKLEAKRYMSQVVADECNMMSRKVDKELAKIMQVMQEHERLLKAIQKENKVFLEMSESVDVTLSNVLLAIRQNSFLQAWYPEQFNRPEQKVVGKYKE